MAHHDLVMGCADIADGVVWIVDGAPSPAHWIAPQLDVEVCTVRDWIRVGRTFRELHASADAWASGEISYAKARALASLLTSENEAELLKIAKSVPASEIGRALARWSQPLHRHGQLPEVARPINGHPTVPVQPEDHWRQIRLASTRQVTLSWQRGCNGYQVVGHLPALEVVTPLDTRLHPARVQRLLLGQLASPDLFQPYVFGTPLTRDLQRVGGEWRLVLLDETRCYQLWPDNLGTVRSRILAGSHLDQF